MVIARSIVVFVFRAQRLPHERNNLARMASGTVDYTVRERAGDECLMAPSSAHRFWIEPLEL